MNLAHLIKRPVITEKSIEATKQNRYTFEVDLSASKGQIKAAVEQYFKVDVVSVNTTKLSGKLRRTGRRRLPTVTPDTKKAVVTIKPGQTIKVFETKN